MKPKLVIFDVDGTLVDSLSISYDIDSQIIAELGGRVPDVETYREHLGEKDWEDFYKTFGVKETSRALSLYHTKASQKKSVAISGTEELLEQIRSNNILTAIVSVNKDLDHIISKLQSAGLEKYFDKHSIHCVSNIKTEAIRRECEDRKVSFNEALYVGDTAKDIREARAAGIRTVAISNKHSYNPDSLIRQANPDYIFKDIIDMVSLLQEDEK